MTDNAHNLVDIALKVATPLGVCALLVLQTQFVSRQEFVDASVKLSARVETIERVLVRMEASAETDRRHDSALSDHEGRLRNLESRP
jgi:hypothetical protein